MVSSIPTTSFLDLPPEIRNQIYQNILLDNHGIFINNLHRPSISATCTQIQRESLPIFFSINRFELHLSRPFPNQDCTLLLRPWTSSFLRNARPYVSHITALNVYATIKYKVWNGFFSVWHVRIDKQGYVRFELDVSRLLGRARALCIPVLLALEEGFGSGCCLEGTKGMGVEELERLVSIFRPHVLNGEEIWLGIDEKVRYGKEGSLAVES